MCVPFSGGFGWECFIYLRRLGVVLGRLHRSVVGAELRGGVVYCGWQFEFEMRAPFNPSKPIPAVVIEI